MLGNWKNYEELESNLSLDELFAIIKASREKENREQRFVAAINGIDVDSNEEKATQDILSLRGSQAYDEGFGVGAGIGVVELGE